MLTIEPGVTRQLRKKMVISVFGLVLIGCVGLTTPAGANPVSSKDLSKILSGSRHGHAAFDLKGSNGFSLEVSVSRGEVSLEAKGHGGIALYSVPGRIQRNWIRARFGRRGKVLVRFKPTGRVQRGLPPIGCVGRARTTTYGVFVGHIRFVGEKRYTEIAARRARGDITTHARWKCVGKHRHDAAGPHSRLPLWGAGDEILLEAVARRGRLRFDVHRSVGGRGYPESTIFSASLAEQRGRMEVSRFTLVFARTSAAFSFDQSLTTASVAPPAPFNGTATFQRNAGRPASWAGSLAVSLPGTAEIPVVGTDFHSRLYRLSEDGIATSWKLTRHLSGQSPA